MPTIKKPESTKNKSTPLQVKDKYLNKKPILDSKIVEPT